jgi:DNA repair protein RecO
VNQQVASGIVLSRTNFGEADRIITFLTVNEGKLRLMAKGVRKIKSKLAGGVELFSVSNITYVKGRGEIGTLISARLSRHYGSIVNDIDRVQLGYQLIKIINQATEDHYEEDYFDLMVSAFRALEDPVTNRDLIMSWFESQLLKLAGHSPNMSHDLEGNKLEAEKLYSFDIDNMSFNQNISGKFDSNHIKVMRILFSDNEPEVINRVSDLKKYLQELGPLVHTLYIHTAS